MRPKPRVGESGEASLLSLLACVMPSEQRTWLLRACLYSGSAARQAWATWCRMVGDPKREFEEDRQGLKGLLPFIEFALQRSGIQADRELRTYLRVAAVREELRNRIYSDVLHGVLNELAAAQIPALVLRGAALSDSVYGIPGVRHNHEIALIVESRYHEAASQRLGTLAFRCQQGPERDGKRRCFTHKTGLPLVLSSHLFSLPHFRGLEEAVWANSTESTLAGAPVRVPSAEHHILHICERGFYTRERSNLRWLCDQWLLVQAYPNMDWDGVLRMAIKTRLAIPTYVTFEYLRSQLGAAIPADVTEELRVAAGEKMDSVALEAAFAAATLRLSPSEIVHGLRKDPRCLIRFAKFALAPSAIYMQWKHGVSGAELPVRYISRPLRHALRCVRRLCVRTSGGRKLVTEADIART